MTAPEKHCEQIDVIKRAVKLPRLCKYLKTAQHNYNHSASALLLRCFIFCMAEASAKRVTGGELQGTMGRVSFPPSFAHTFVSKERRLGMRQIIIRDRDC